jgi:hypothetical protein
MEGRMMSEFVGALKDAYEIKMRLIDDTFKLRSTEAYEAKWTELAETLHTNGLDPFSYIQFVFDFCGEKLDGFYLNLVLSSKMVSKFKAQLPKHNAALKVSMKLQVDHVESRLKGGDTIEQVLADDYAPVNAALRFALAWSEKKYELAEPFRGAAEIVMTFEPYIRQLLNPWLPDDMKGKP